MDHMEKAKKKRIKRYLTWAALAAVVALLAAMPLLAQREAEADGPVASVLSAQARTMDMTAALKGGGTLEASDDQEVNLPSGVKITEFLVKNGQFVTEGTPVARVDKVSVMTAITGVNETLDYLREELEDAREETIDATITATAGGRVKRVFADPGEDVREVMLRDGCLAILSLDGLMAVKLDVKAPLTTGQAVTVTFRSGDKAEGRVESNLSGQIVITLEDEEYGIGQTVTVTTEDGEELGQGELYIHNAWKATAYSGTIATVSARQETTVGQGATLFTLKNTDYEGQLRHRANQHREYEALLQRLLTMYRSGTIDAPCDGVISGVDQDSAHLLAAEGEAAPAGNLAGDYEGVSLMLLSSGTGPVCAGKEGCDPANHIHAPACPLACTGLDNCPATVSAHQKTCIKYCAKDNTCTAPSGCHHVDCIRLCTSVEKPEDCKALTHYNECIHSCNPAAKADEDCKGTKYHHTSCIKSCLHKERIEDCPATGAHYADCIGKCSSADVVGVCEATAYHRISCVESCTGKSDCPADKHKDNCYFTGMTYKAYAALVESTGTSELVVRRDPTTLYAVDRVKGAWVITGGTFNADLMVYPDTIPASNAGAFKKGDTVLIVYGYRGESLEWSSVVLYKSAPSVSADALMPSGGIPAFGGMMTGNFAGFGNYSGATPETEELFDKEGSPLMTVTPRDSMVLAVELDEKDISKVSVGMEATVKVEALRGQTFPAEITRVGTQGANSGGSSKFTVELTLDAAEDMLSGMSATAEIPLEVRHGILTIPLAALREDGARTVVCTALDDQGQPAEPVEVKTGLSDTENVEIVEGIASGDTVYYLYYDVLELDTSAEAERFTFG